MTAPLYSILITAYECHGMGVQFITENLAAIFAQTYRPLQVVISDHSRNDAIESYVNSISDKNGVDLIYVRYNENYGNPSANWNNAMNYASGDLWQLLALDDRLSDPSAVARVVDFSLKNPDAQWFACAHLDQPGGVFVPSWNPYTLYGNNLISGPSAIVYRSSLKHVQLDPQFLWFLDVDWYYRIWLQAGPPVIFPEVTWINRLHAFQLSNTAVTDARRRDEEQRMCNKYGTPLPLS